MKAKQLYFVLVAFFILAFIGLFSMVYGADKLISRQASQLSKVRADSNIVAARQVALAKNKQDISKYSSLNTIAETIVPQDKDQAEAVREIVNLAQQSGIPKLSSIAFPASTLGNSTAGGGAIKATAGNSALTQLTPVKGMAGVYLLQITITQQGQDAISYNQLITFLGKLEQNRRTAQVSSLTIQPSNGAYTFNLTINEYIKP